MSTWNTTIEDTSPLFDFSPYSDGAASGGWASYFAQIGYFNGNGGEDSKGADSVHITSFPGASVSMQFEGTAIYLYGSANSTYAATLDSNPSSLPANLPDGLLFWQDNLSPGTHSVTLTASPKAGSTQQVAFDKAIVTNVGTNTSELTPVKYDSQSTVLSYSGKWAKQTAYNVPSPYMETSDPLASVSLQFSGGAVAINSMRDWGHWTYNITLDGETTSYNASTWWLMPDTVLFYQDGLDLTKNHTIELINTGMQTYYKLSLGYFTVFQLNNTPAAGSSSSSISSSASTSSTQGAPTPSQSLDALHTSSKKTNVGVIVGPIIAVLAVLAALGLAVLWWKRKRAQERAGPIDPFPPPESRQDMWDKEYASPEVSHTVPPIMPYSGKRGLNNSASIVNLVTTPAPAPPPPPAPAALPEAPAPGATASTPTQPQTQSSRYTHSVDPPSSPARPQTVDVNQIIELIAQRIDPGVRSRPLPTAPDGEMMPPPRYPA